MIDYREYRLSDEPIFSVLSEQKFAFVTVP